MRARASKTSNKKARQRVVYFRVPAETYEQLKRTAAVVDRPVAVVIRRLVLDGLARGAAA